MNLSEERRNYDGDLGLGLGYVEKRMDPDDRKRNKVMSMAKGSTYIERRQKLSRGGK